MQPATRRDGSGRAPWQTTSRAGGGALYRVERDGRIDRVLDGLTISNGIGWSPDGATMYLADSGLRVVRAYDFHPDFGTLSSERTIVTLDADLGAPDGLTVDAGGDLWIAVYGGGQVRRYTPEGALRRVVEFPTVQTTCCAFAGPGLSRLYVTTATEGWTDEQRLATPAAGLVYSVDTDATGRPAAPFRPESTWWSAR